MEGEKKGFVNKVVAVLSVMLLWIVGMGGAKTIKAKVPAAFSSYSDYGLLAGALAGAYFAKPAWLKSIATGGALYAAINILNAFMPDVVKTYLPALGSVGGTDGLGYPALGLQENLFLGVGDPINPNLLLGPGQGYVAGMINGPTMDEQTVASRNNSFL